MKQHLVLLIALGLLWQGPNHALRAPVHFSLVAPNTSTPSGVQLALTTEIIKETYCDGPDPDFFTLKILLGLSFQNVGLQRVILQRGGKSLLALRLVSQ